MEPLTFLSQVVRWAETRSEVLGVALVGSHARGQARPESDIDLVLLTTNPTYFIQNSAWVEAFGPVQSISVEDYRLLTSLRVFYADGPEVEFGLTTPQWAALPLDAGTRRVLSDGHQILYDPHGLFVQAARGLHS